MDARFHIGRPGLVSTALAVTVLAGCQTADSPEVNSEAVRITNHAAEDRAPSWSPDGTRILFASDRDGDFEIYQIGPDGSGLERITRNPAADRDPAWAPAGDRFVFQSDRDGRAGLWIQELTADLGDTKPWLLFEDASPELGPDWSPDGKWIVFTSDRDGNPELYRIAVEAGPEQAPERLTDEPYRNVWPRYSADGESLIFFSRRATAGESDDLFRLDLETRKVTQLTDHPTHHDFVPDPGPDGRIVAGYSDRAANVRQLVVFGPEGEIQRRFADGYHRVFQPAWSPDGKRIAYAARLAEGERADLYIEPAQ